MQNIQKYHEGYSLLLTTYTVTGCVLKRYTSTEGEYVDAIRSYLQVIKIVLYNHTLFSYDSYVMHEAHFSVEDIVALFSFFSTRSTHLNQIHS
jgi:hypothetical protein